MPNFKGSVTYKRPTTRFLRGDANAPIPELRITRVNADIARVHFVDNNGDFLGIPPLVQMHQWVLHHLTGQWVEGQLNYPVDNQWFITWMGSYRITNDGTEVVRITNQKQQALSVHDGHMGAVSGIIGDEI